MNERKLTSPYLAECSAYIHQSMALANLTLIFLGTMNEKTDPVLVDRLRTVRREVNGVRALVRALRDDFDGRGMGRVRYQSSGELESSAGSPESESGQGTPQSGGVDGGL